MADSKSYYSENASNYINNIVPFSEIDKKNYDNSKKREGKFNSDWKNYMVNINDVVEKFTPVSDKYRNGYKYIYENDRYQVVTDMVAGYLRIIDKKTNQPVKLDGKPGSRAETHFKIKKRGEM